jgi:hypothetical protein
MDSVFQPVDYRSLAERHDNLFGELLARRLLKSFARMVSAAMARRVDVKNASQRQFVPWQG